MGHQARIGAISVGQWVSDISMHDKMNTLSACVCVCEYGGGKKCDGV